MIKLTPDAEAKIITVIRPWFLDDSDKGLGDSINIKRSRPCQGELDHDQSDDENTAPCANPLFTA
jgi:hypothetical protein